MGRDRNNAAALPGEDIGAPYATRRELILSPRLRAVSLSTLRPSTRGVLHDRARHSQRRRARRPRAARGWHTRAPRRIDGARWLLSGPRVSHLDRVLSHDVWGDPAGDGRV